MKLKATLKRIFSSKQTKKRSVVFFRNSYYHFYYLAQALRKRGWDAISVSLDDPKGANQNFYHGEDLNLFSSDPNLFKKNLDNFFAMAKKRFQLFHFSGDGYLYFFPEYHNQEDPPDIIEWRKLGKKVAYTVSGCNSATAQSSVAKWSMLDNNGPVCGKCIWQSRSDVCSNEKNLAWGKKVAKYCDLIFTETLPALDYMDVSSKVIRDPLTMCLDPNFWHPDLQIPEEFLQDRTPNEILVYHAVGNYEMRTQNGRNIKGTPAVFAAIDRLKAEGFCVKLIFVTNMKNKEVRYIQAQADIIVDQLNMGRYGATAREGMMLGKPVICYINPREMNPSHELSCLKEAPLVSATEANVYDVIKDLIIHPEKRIAIGERAREYALKWHAAESCAERYEELCDRIIS